MQEDTLACFVVLPLNKVTVTTSMLAHLVHVSMTQNRRYCVPVMDRDTFFFLGGRFNQLTSYCY